MKFENTDVWGFEHAIRGMRNPLESWNKSDSKYKNFIDPLGGHMDSFYTKFIIGKKDLELMQKLIKAGSEHRKFMRQIMVSVDITAPLYWWKEFDTYKIGTTANSTSTMHKLASTPITIECFEIGDFEDFYVSKNMDVPELIYVTEVTALWADLLTKLEELRQKYLETKDKRYWKELIRLLPSSWLQTRTVTLNYENIFNMVHQREKHKLTEWSVGFMVWVNLLPYSKELLFNEI